MGKNKKLYYSGLDGLRAFAAIAIVLIHLRANTTYEIDGWIYNVFIASLGKLTSLFMMISAFSMCCGYYDKIKENRISLNEFYNKRYKRILPLFALLVLLELIANGITKTTIIEGFADVTLLFGFLANSSIEVVGVGWTLGVIFAFYIVFPFFVYTIWNKKRAFFWFAVSLGLTYACENYFLVDGQYIKCNFIMWMSFFIAGGIIYLYREEIKNVVERIPVVTISIVFIITALRFLHLKVGQFELYTLCRLLSDMGWIVIAISLKSNILANSITKFLSDYSFEIYLSHMMMFRILEKLHIIYFIKNPIIAFICSFILMVVGAICFAKIVRITFVFIEEKMQLLRKKNDETTI